MIFIRPCCSFTSLWPPASRRRASSRPSAACSMKRKKPLARAYLEEAGYEVLEGSIPESLTYRDAHNRGRSLTETDEQSFNERADALIEALLTKVAAITVARGGDRGSNSYAKRRRRMSATDRAKMLREKFAVWFSADA